MHSQIIKKILPKYIKNKIKDIINLYDKILNFNNTPFIITNIFGIKLIKYPWDKRHIRLIKSGHDITKEFIAFNILVKPNDTIFDVGANVGIMSVHLSRLTKKNGKVYSFEPVKNTYNMLLETIGLNHCTNINTYQIAISDSKADSKIYTFDQNNHTLNSLGKVDISGRMPISEENVKTKTLDHFYEENNIKNIDFLKIDVEGFEENVLKGSNNLLKNNLIKYIQFEISEMPLKSLGKKSSDIFKILQMHGYNIFSFNLETKKFIGPILHPTNSYDNYYASQNNLNKL